MSLNVITTKGNLLKKMTKEEFLSKRTPVFVDPEIGTITLVNNSNLKDKDFAEIFSNIKISWLDTTRGYLLDDFLMLYINDYEIPRFHIGCCTYFFNMFPNINWLGLGCNKGKPGEIWIPKLIVSKGDICSL